MSRRFLAVDYGRARIGLAVSDVLGLTAKPIGFVQRETDQQAAVVVAAVAKREQVVGIVLGLPLHAHGDAGENATWVRNFAKRLAKLVAVPLHECDERHSTGEAEAELRALGTWPCKPGQLDAQAAAVVLRRFLAGER
jgi:putative Holliday junction resolvase